MASRAKGSQYNLVNKTMPEGRTFRMNSVMNLLKGSLAFFSISLQERLEGCSSDWGSGLISVSEERELPWHCLLS